MAEEAVDKSSPENQENPEMVLKERIFILEKTLAEREIELDTVKKSIEKLQEALTVGEAELGKAASDYRKLVLQSNPDVTEELITGNSISEINESLAKAKTLISKVRQSVEKEIARTRVPVGSPGRQTPDLSALSPREKIHYAIGGKK
jgi:hypothetical protein